ncbi:hypothetical protein GO013_03155 [Pseudodesulfovibrio sp. JC047]|uniref:hypothetical protein n=1 Tax=Pseudodesulfovibrio sp. JC047 TaxID=2683199 RepID=UPI0013D63829|nr:hypothetical protein [Pseudodesulfovibrio sp. JC047]NDV18416.1 hypothetical protein [Pseudodesulfovibrio sp. JC047]
MAVTKSTPPSSASGMSSKTKKTLAKAGMATTLGTLVATGLMETNKTDTLKKVHLWSGFALVGFSYWHYSLYKK